MPKKLPSQLPILPPDAQTLLRQPALLLTTLNYLASALSGRTIAEIDLAGSLALQENPTAYTIVSGVIDIEEGTGQNISSRSAIIVETEGGAASDDLDTIDGGRDGMILFLRATDDTHTIVIKNGTGNIVLIRDISLDTYSKALVLIYNSTLSKWIGVEASLASHEAAEDPHPGYLTLDEHTAVDPGAFEPLTTGDPVTPTLVFADGDVVMVPMEAE